jgi:hypothetical protein
VPTVIFKSLKNFPIATFAMKAVKLVSFFFKKNMPEMEVPVRP